MWRTAVFAASALRTGAKFGRRLLDEEVERRKTDAIREAAERARAEIRLHGRTTINQGLRGFLAVTLVKAAVLSMILAARWLGYLDAGMYTVATAIALGLMLVSDAIRNFPNARLIFGHLRKNGWNPRRALGAAVAAEVMERVLEEANAQERDIKSEIVMALAGHSRSEVHQAVAEAVARIAADTSWSDLRPFVMSAGLRVAVVMALYGGFVFLMVNVF